jgi:hypothetical protein
MPDQAARKELSTIPAVVTMNPLQLAQLFGYRGLRMIEQVYARLNAADRYVAVVHVLTSER